MTRDTSQGEKELIVYFPAATVPSVAAFVIVGFTAALVLLPALVALWLLFLGVNHLLVLAGWGSENWLLIRGESSWIPVAGACIAVLVFAVPLCLLIARVAVHWGRKLRRSWWLRLSGSGFEINDRIFTPRRYEWAEIDKFMLAAPAGQVQDAPAEWTTYSDAFLGGVDTPPTIVAFHYRPERRRRRSLASTLFFHATSRDGTKADGPVMGYWDRPAGEAVDLLNEWLTRHRSI